MFSLYLSSEVKIGDRLVVVVIIVIKTPLFNCWSD